MRRDTSYGQIQRLSPVDQLGVWLSERGVRRAVRSFDGLAVADIGCGYNASLGRRILPRVSSLTLMDVALAPDLGGMENISAIVGQLPGALQDIADQSFDVVLCLSVLEHVWDARGLMKQCRRILRDGGTCIVNVPTWLGRRFLEFSAFRLGLSPRQEMDDHKRYYDPKDLWPVLVEAGFLPHEIALRRHKGGLNLIAVCRTDRIEP